MDQAWPLPEVVGDHDPPVVGCRVIDEQLGASAAALPALPGVDEVTVDVAGGRVTISGTGELSDSEVGAAAERAGYELVGAGPA